MFSKTIPTPSFFSDSHATKPIANVAVKRKTFLIEFMFLGFIYDFIFDLGGFGSWSNPILNKVKPRAYLGGKVGGNKEYFCIG